MNVSDSAEAKGREIMLRLQTCSNVVFLLHPFREIAFKFSELSIGGSVNHAESFFGGMCVFPGDMSGL
jgi:hypothetical protein